MGVRALLVRDRIQMTLYECIDARGYEGRLTERKVYKTGWLARLISDEFGEITFDDGTTGEVYRERFKAALDEYEIALRDGEISRFEFDLIKSGKVNGIAGAIAYTRKMKEPLSEIIFEEGESCFCGGKFEFPLVQGCTCYCGHPPCSQCVSNELVCSSCGITAEEAEEKAIEDKEEIQNRVTLTEIVTDGKIHVIDGRRAKDGEITIQEALRRGMPPSSSKILEQVREENINKFRDFQDKQWIKR